MLQPSRLALVVALSVAGAALEAWATEKVCEPGRSVHCACVTGESGAQICAPDGGRWLPCECSGKMDRRRPKDRRPRRRMVDVAEESLRSETRTPWDTAAEHRVRPALVRVAEKYELPRVEPASVRCRRGAFCKITSPIERDAEEHPGKDQRRHLAWREFYHEVRELFGARGAHDIWRRRHFRFDAQEGDFVLIRESVLRAAAGRDTDTPWAQRNAAAIDRLVDREYERLAIEPRRARPTVQCGSEAVCELTFYRGPGGPGARLRSDLSWLRAGWKGTVYADRLSIFLLRAGWRIDPDKAEVRPAD